MFGTGDLKNNWKHKSNLLESKVFNINLLLMQKRGTAPLNRLNTKLINEIKNIGGKVYAYDRGKGGIFNSRGPSLIEITLP